ncbi:DUF2964 family protein [Paraburkholderia hospita]|uniref:DUF2964 domain-containing protein n=1 Tax=Paraburkholderia hospita TaxID=169430 RepID=A0AAN1MNG2_9BURK|nr:DUF2964 family protein [Paraburkholderia hospita]AUT73391.1 DUF2964 domain-containing protein [Paraburkholderia hospita]EIM98868.1 hypothetical protein WQE_20871 [Paraburkholderia hospita]OUL71966.1 hypothetical protein CA602_44125 [Paraburkholderia hospita]OUL76689.1 hypothetical protein CA601_40325 [Paraburkholderia hospita]SEH77647.1 Protein of unknown function [Paraburkholderia hospita]
MFRLKLRSTLLKIGVFIAVGGPLAFKGLLSGHEEIARYAAAAVVIVIAGFVVLLKPTRSNDA